jgi:hypothetical protein
MSMTARELVVTTMGIAIAMTLRTSARR